MLLFILFSEFYKPINFVSEFCKICQNPTSAVNVKNCLPENLLETNINCLIILKQQGNSKLRPRLINRFSVYFARKNKVPLNQEMIWSLTFILLI